MSSDIFDIFISYRRKGGGSTAGRINDLLVREGYTVSYDIDTLRAGRFDKQLLERVEQCVDFILIVNENCFDRTLNPETDPQDDWLRQELAYALKLKKNVIPVLLAGASFPKGLPEEIANVRYCQGPKYTNEYFDSFFNKLKGYLHAMPRMTFSQQNENTRHLPLAPKVWPKLKIRADLDCIFFIDGEEKAQIKAGCIYKTPLAVGQYILKIVSSDNNADFIEIDFDMPNAEKVQKVCLRAVRDKRCEKEAEEKRKEELRIAEENAKRKAEAIVLNENGCEYYQQEKYDEAVDCWHKAAEYGNVDAQYNLGRMYQKGQGVEQSDAEAVKWYGVAAENGHVEAQGQFGICYFNGSGVEKRLLFSRNMANQGC